MISVNLELQAKWSGDGAGQQDQLTGEAERILKQSQSKFFQLKIRFICWSGNIFWFYLFQRHTCQGEPPSTWTWWLPSTASTWVGKVQQKEDNWFLSHAHLRFLRRQDKTRELVIRLFPFFKARVTGKDESHCFCFFCFQRVRRQLREIGCECKWEKRC